MKIIQTFEYEKEKLHKINAAKFGSNWPVVYILEGEKEAYVGETTDAYKRSQQHMSRADRKRLKKIHIIGDEEFNKSAVLDIEALLIGHMAADGRFVLQNGNGGLQNHRYYNKDLYHDIKFEIIWREMMRNKLADKPLIQIRNSDIFKFSPYKALTEDQLEIAKEITKTILTTDQSSHLIKGEPGSGKTILAVFLVKYLMQMKPIESKKIGLVIPMTSLRKTLKAVFKQVKGLSPSMVLGPNDVVKSQYDILIVDEAHRLTRRKGIQGYGAYDQINDQRGWDKYSTTQLDWIERSASHILLFYDGNQSIKPADIPRACFEKYEKNQYVLKSQMRVLGGSDYIEYIENIVNHNPVAKKTFDNYEFKLFENVNDMVELIKIRDRQVGLARNVAGFAWDWISKEDKSKKDIVIYHNNESYGYMWNSLTMDWVNSPNAINEVGCIHSIQGYDLNFAGVIIGPEFIMRDGKLKVDKSKYRDKKGKFDVQDEEILLAYVRNIYKVLMTRGIRGTYIYVCDLELRDYFRKFVDVVDDIVSYRLKEEQLKITNSTLAVAEKN